jgi:hypothetical protein
LLQDGVEGKPIIKDAVRSALRERNVLAMLTDHVEDAVLMHEREAGAGSSSARGLGSDAEAVSLSKAASESESLSGSGEKRRLLSASMQNVDFAANDVENVIAKPHSVLMRYISMGLAVTFLLLAALELVRRFRRRSQAAGRYIPRSRVV